MLTQLPTTVGLPGLFWFGVFFSLFGEYLLEASVVASRGFIYFTFCQQVPWYLWVLPSLPLPLQALLPCGPLSDESSLLGASLFTKRLLLGEGPIPDASFFDKAPFLGFPFSVLALSSNSASAFSAAAASRFFASSTSFSAISLREQNLNLRYCKKRETDLYWLSNYSSNHSMSSMKCHRVEKQKVSNYLLKFMYVLTAFPQSRTQVSGNTRVKSL